MIPLKIQPLLKNDSEKIQLIFEILLSHTVMTSYSISKPNVKRNPRMCMES